jgi:hypothetical protein
MYLLLSVVPSPAFKPIVEKANENFKVPQPMSPEDQEFVEALRFGFGYAVSERKLNAEEAVSFAFEHWREYVPLVRGMLKVREHIQSLPPEEQQRAIQELQRAARGRGR